MRLFFEEWQAAWGFESGFSGFSGLSKKLGAAKSCARSSHWFESGFSGFTGLAITSLVGLGRLLLNVLSCRSFSPMRYASAKRRVKSNSL